MCFSGKPKASKDKRNRTESVGLKIKHWVGMGKKKEMATKKSGAQKDKKRIPNANLRHVEQVC